MKELAFCPHCMTEVPFNAHEVEETTACGGVEYTYQTHQALCAVCGEEAVYQPFEEEAGAAFNEAVREAKGIISLGLIREIPKKYRIGKRPLSRLLEWGELTYTRFVDGQVPSKKYSDRLNELYHNPSIYYRLLKNGRGRISETAYRKSEKAVLAVLNNDFPESTKLYEIADYYHHLSNGDITTMTLQKLIYYAHGFSIVFLEKPLSKQQPKAWAAGPVYGQVWHEFKNEDVMDEYDITRVNERFASPFSAEEEELLHAVYDSFGVYSGSVLSKFTHDEMPWQNARKRACVADGDPSNEAIKYEDMQAFFKEVAHLYSMKGCRDIGSYAQAKFAQVIKP